MNPVTKFAAVTLTTITLLIAGALMDGPTDIEAAQDVDEDYAQAVADGGNTKCAALGRVPLWTNAGDLVCRLPAGHQVAGGKP